MTTLAPYTAKGYFNTAVLRVVGTELYLNKGSKSSPTWTRLGPDMPIKSPSKAGLAGRWQRGQSGNPSGMRPGSRHKATVFAESLLSGEAEALVRKTVELAKAGDTAALKICMDRILPPARERPCRFKLPRLETCADAVAALGLVAEGLANGELLPHEAESLTNVVMGFVKTIEATTFEERLSALEQVDEDVPREQRCYDA
jgi:Family of unknown function (DUF5681)